MLFYINIDFSTSLVYNKIGDFMENNDIIIKKRVYELLQYITDKEAYQTLRNIIPIVLGLFGKHINSYDIAYKLSNISIESLDTSNVSNTLGAINLQPFDFSIYLNPNISKESKEIAIIHEFMHILTKYYDVSGIVSKKNSNYNMLNEILNHVLTYDVIKSYKPSLIKSDLSYYKKPSLIFKEFSHGLFPNDNLYSYIFNNELGELKNMFEGVGVNSKMLRRFNKEFSVAFKYSSYLADSFSSEYVECITYKWGTYLMAAKKTYLTQCNMDEKSIEQVDSVIAEYYDNYNSLIELLDINNLKELPFVDINLEREYKKVTGSQFHKEFYDNLIQQECEIPSSVESNSTLEFYRNHSQELFDLYNIDLD